MGIFKTDVRDEVDYVVGGRRLALRFFTAGEMYLNPLVPGRMQVLRQKGVTHGGYAEIREGGEDREGWNFVLVRDHDGTKVEWRVVETEVSALTGRVARYKPFATEAQLFADNLACHMNRAMHIYQLKDKALERTDVVSIFDKFLQSL